MVITQKLRLAARRLESVLLPSFCLNCRAETPEEPASLRWLCFNCHGLLTPRWTKGSPPPEVDGAYHIFNYQTDTLAKKLIHALKYELVREIISTIAVALQRESAHLRRLIQTNQIDLIVPLPLHWRRLRDRGFNQSDLIAREIVEIIQRPLIENMLKRKFHRQPQMRVKNRKNRERNIRGIFECVNPGAVKGKNVLLVDDVATTGATLREAARALKAAGAAKIFAFTLAQD
ncbi:MAG: ComF family protein [Parcubacteria group bacterium]|nr:ComF family protein [Parcubacteria group bacterium]